MSVPRKRSRRVTNKHILEICRGRGSLTQVMSKKTEQEGVHCCYQCTVRTDLQQRSLVPGAASPANKRRDGRTETKQSVRFGVDVSFILRVS
jgi:hypothetical protein